MKNKNSGHKTDNSLSCADFIRGGHKSLALFITFFLAAVFQSFLFAAAAYSTELAAPESKAIKVGSTQYLKHSAPVRFNARVGAYYYWRILFSDMASDEFYTRDTLYHQFSLKALAPGGSGYKAVLQRKLYAWEPWKNYYEDPTRYAIDSYEPVINTMLPASGIVSRDPAPTFTWKAYDEGSGLAQKPYMFMLVTGSQKPLYNSGWVSDESYTPSQPLLPGTYMWGIHVRDNDENIAMSKFYSFSINSSEPPLISHFEAAGTGARKDYTSTEDIMISLGATDNIGVTHYYISEISNPLDVNDPKWTAAAPPATIFSTTVPFKIKFKENHFTPENNYSYSHKLFLWFKDYENNVSEMKSIGLIVDAKKPWSESVKINNGALYTLKREVKLKLWATDNVGVAGYLIKESPGVPAAPSHDDPGWVMNRTFELLKNGEFDFTLSDGTGSKTLHLWYRDDSGNISDRAEASILFDTKPPLSPIIGSLGIKGESASGYVNSPSLTLILKASGSYNNQITAYYLKESASPAAPAAEDSGWTPFTKADVKVEAEKEFVLSPGDGTKEIYAWYKDSYSNISDPCKCVVLFDRQPPSGSFSVAGEERWINRKNIELDCTASDAVGVNAYLASLYCYSMEELKANPNYWNYVVPQKNIAFTTNISLSSTNGERQVFLWLKDEAGNISQPIVKVLKYDNLPPVLGREKLTVTKVAGSSKGMQNGPAETAQFDFIDSLYVNKKGEIYIADFRNKMVRILKNGMVSLFAGTGSENRSSENVIPYPFGIVEDDFGVVYICDGHISKKVTPDGKVSRYVGNDFRNPNNEFHHSGDDPIIETSHISRAEFRQISGICMDRFGNAYISDVKHIRKVRNEIVTVYAGNTKGSNADGISSDVKLNNVADVTVDEAGVVYFVDAGSSDIRKITTDMRLITIAGKNGIQGFKDGYPNENLVNNPTSIVVDKTGVLYIGDFGNRKLRRITPDGFMSTFEADTDSIQILNPQGLSPHPDGGLVFGEQELDQIKHIAFDYSNGLQLVSGNGPDDGTLTLALTASDNYSGISAYYLSDTPDAPAPTESGWTELDYKGGEQTFEVAYRPARPGEAQTVYAWLKDNAGNVSGYESLKINEKTMQIVESIGAGELSSPAALACDKQNNIYVADSSNNPLSRFTPEKIHSRHGIAGYAADRLGETINSIVCFNDGNIGVVEKSKLRFSFLDPFYKIINYITLSIDLALNYNDSQTTVSGDLKNKINDKYYNENRKNEFGIKYGYNYDFTYEPDFYFSPDKLEVYKDADYTQKLNGPVSSYKYPVLYLKVSGSGSESQKVNSLIARVRTTGDTAGIGIQFVETGADTNVFKASLNLGKSASLFDSRIGIELNDKIYLTFYSRIKETTFNLDVKGSWVEVGANLPLNSAATNLSMIIHDGIVYVAYSDDQQGGKLTVIKCENEKWVFVGNPGISEGMVREVKLDMLDSRLCVLYTDSSSEYKTTVMFFNGTKWGPLGDRAFSEPNASFLSMTTAGDSVFIAYTNWMFGGLPQIMKYAPDTGWKKFSSKGLFDKHCDFNNIVSDNGVLYFLTRDKLLAGFLLYKFVNNEWIALTDGPQHKKCEMLRLRIISGVPYVAYADLGTGLLYLKKFEDNEWKKIGKGAVSEGRSLFCDLAISGKVPYMIYIDNSVGNKIVVSKFINDEWVNVGEKGISSGISDYCAIECYNNEPYIAFRDVHTGEKIKVLKFEY